MPTVSPASSADMAPISSGSSTWTSSGIPFSFVSMATGIGPSSSGSQATVASVVTSTLLAGLGFSGGVISSFPSSVWPSRAPSNNPPSARHTSEPNKPTKDASAVTTAAHTDNSKAGGKDRENSKCQGEDGEREGEDKDEEEEEEEEEEKDKKKGRKGSGGMGAAGRKESRTAVKETPSETPDATAKEKEPDLMNTPPDEDTHLEVYTHNLLEPHTPTPSVAAVQSAEPPALKDPAATRRPSPGGDRKHRPVSIHTGEPLLCMSETISMIICRATS
ncbi:receptor-type tyrosine-protein phosphatase gamma-like [Notothenia coriiceps]|uniref:Receptor-type tyrosine-protein phosphatase gamma-like n=1 Tax=Notothenia coriiceps TaxID=8208 RepID=A0A6I9MC93_9TELE|nr:PREDICTED: receptor-type tyrosine-protein phosphatase gamma-like [Notothenia coriiceps]